MAILRDNKNYACDMRSLFYGHTTYCRTKRYAQPYIPVQMRPLVHEGYRELGANYFDERRRQFTVDRLTRRIERLGYHVHLEPVAVSAA
jgi:hypothetical protein